MSNRIIVIAALVASLAGASLGCGSAPTTATVSFDSDAGEVTTDVLEVADSPDERSRGLMGRTEIGGDAGMLFAYDEPTTGTFWMQDTLIPLSIAFWGSDGRIHTITEMEPCTVETCPTYAPNAPYVFALEMRQGWFDRNGVEAGDRARVLLVD